MKSPDLGLRTDQFEYVQLILLAVIVGILGALGNLGFRGLIGVFTWLFRDLEWNLLGIERGGIFRIFTPVVLLSGGAVMLLLDYFFPDDILGYGFPHFLEQINLGNARIKRRWIVLKGLGAAVSLGSGASVGREGPIAQIGGAIGSALAQLRGLSADRAKVLVAAGAGAGIATTFNAPIGGLMFALEIVLLGQAETANLALLIISTFSAVVTSRAIVGNESVFHVPPFILRSYWEMLTYALLGVALGVLSASYTRAFNATAAYFRRMNLPAWQKLAIGLSIVGGIAIFLPANLADGYPIINRAMAGDYGLWMLLALCAAKYAASSLSLGAGAPGGVFGPIFFIGTMAGGAFQRISAMVMPHLTGPRGSYALVGLGAFLAGTTHAPLTALFLLFEMTGDFNVTLPTMIAAVAALVVSRAIETESIDTYRLAREGKTLQISQERLALTQIPVGAVMTKEVTVVSANTRLNDILHIAGQTAQSTLPVVGSEGELIGLIVTHDLLALLGGGSDLGPLVNAFDIAQAHCPKLTADQNLDTASQLMEQERLDEIPVVAQPHNGRFLGLVTRQHIAQALNRVSVSLSALATREQNIYWATGYRVTRIEVPAAADGATIRKLDARARFDVTILALQGMDDPDGGFVPVAPDRKLKPGDTIVAAGRPADIRRFERELALGGSAASSKAAHSAPEGGKT
ncbi:MAG TPA: chloride channel protein [Candidatus Binataceae bacterium]|nr:chloride channel protein [Candidatus Binataceae bacterium]